MGRSAATEAGVIRIIPTWICFLCYSCIPAFLIDDPARSKPLLASNCRLPSFASALRSPGHSDKYFAPELFGFGQVAALGGDVSQIAPREMAIDSLVDAAKLVGPVQCQDAPPRDLSLR